MKLEDTANYGRRIATLVRSFRSSSHRISVMLSMSRGQVGILNFLSRHPEGVSSGELAEIIGVGTGRIGNALKDMERKGAITRRPNPQDKRCVIVTITPKGEKIVLARRKEFLKNIDYIVEKVGRDNIDSMLSILESIAKAQNEYLDTMKLKGGIADAKAV